MKMSDEAIEAIVDAILDASDNNVDELEDYAEYVLNGLRAAGFELYRPEGCPLVDYWQDTPDDKVALVDDDGRRIYGAGIPDGRYRLVPVSDEATPSADPPTCPECAEVVHDADCPLVGDGRPVDGEGST